MKKLQKLTALLLALLAVFSLCACAGDDDTTTGNPASDNAGDSQPGDNTAGETGAPGEDSGDEADTPVDRTLTIGTTTAPASFLSSMGAVNPYASMVFDTLVMYDENNEIVPGLATEWEYTDDYTLRLTLRDGVKFTEGQTLVASDVLYSLNYWATETTMAESFSAYDLPGCYTEGDNVVVLKFTELYGPAVSGLTQFFIFSEEWAT